MKAMKAMEALETVVVHGTVLLVKQEIAHVH